MIRLSSSETPNSYIPHMNRRIGAFRKNIHIA